MLYKEKKKKRHLSGLEVERAVRSTAQSAVLIQAVLEFNVSLFKYILSNIYSDENIDLS